MEQPLSIVVVGSAFVWVLNVWWSICFPQQQLLCNHLDHALIVNCNQYILLAHLRAATPSVLGLSITLCVLYILIYWWAC